MQLAKLHLTRGTTLWSSYCALHTARNRNGRGKERDRRLYERRLSYNAVGQQSHLEQHAELRPAQTFGNVQCSLAAAKIRRCRPLDANKHMGRTDVRYTSRPARKRIARTHRPMRTGDVEPGFDFGILARSSNGLARATRPAGPNAISGVKRNRFGKQQATCSNVGQAAGHVAEPSSPNSARTRSDSPACM